MSEEAVQGAEPVDSPTAEPPAGSVSPHDGEGEPASEPEPAQPPATEPKEPPFHEHPRFKQIIEDRNRERDERIRLTQRLEQLETASRTPSEEKTDALIERLKTIDPEFAARMQELSSLKDKLEAFEKWQENVDSRDSARTQQDLDREVNGKIAALYEEHKVPEMLQPAYRIELEKVAAEMIKENPQLSLKDLPAVFKSVHEQFTGFLDGVRRDERKSYVADKRGDGPPSPRGVAPKPAADAGPKAPEGIDEREWQRKQIAQNALRKHRSDNDV